MGNWLNHSPGRGPGKASRTEEQPVAHLQSLHGSLSYRGKGECPEDLRVRKSNRHGASTALAVLIAATLGLLVGQALNGGRTVTSCDNLRDAVQPLYDWGDTVRVDGKEQSVTSYLAGKLNTEDIKNNLK